MFISGHVFGKRQTLAALIVIAATAPAASAQTPPASSFTPTWDVAISLGGHTAPTPGAGTGQLPGPIDIIDFGARSTRRVPSWFFGDGALLFNQANLNSFVSPGRIVPLDAGLTAPLARQRAGMTVGGRIGGWVARRTRLEFALDCAATPLEITDAVREAIDETRLSFLAAWGGLQRATDVAVSASAGIDDHASRRLAVTTAVAVDVARVGGGTVFVVAGGGIAMPIGDPPSVVLNGHYQFTSGDVTYVETDAVTIRVRSEGRAPLWTLGGRYERALTMRLGIRAEASLQFAAYEIATAVDAAPSRELSDQAPFVLTTMGQTTFMMFIKRANTVPSSLSAPITDFVTFQGNGYTRHLAVTGGVFWRF